MSFQSPWMLLGLLFLALPIRLHLKSRRAEVIPFPAFFLLAKTVTAKRQTLIVRKALLLLCRILFVIALVTASARPTVSVFRTGGIRAGAPTAVVIVIDNSMSMQIEDEDGESLFEKAKKLAREELGRLRPGDAAAVIATCDTSNTTVPQVDFDLVQSHNAINDMVQTYQPGRLKQKLMVALRILEDCPLTEREVILISDLNEGENLDTPPWSAGSRVDFRTIDPDHSLSRNNLAVVSVKASPSLEGIAREIVVETKIANYSSSAKTGLDVFFEIEGREVARGTVDIPAMSTATKRFFHRFSEDGVFQGLVRIPEDRLRADDRRHFSVLVSGSLSVLVIDGDFFPGSYRSETFYLQRALETSASVETPIVFSVMDIESATKTPLTGNDAVFLSGLSSVSPAMAERIIQYVHHGGSIFISPHEETGDFNALTPILPAKISSVRQSSGNRPVKVGAINRTHPVFDTFGDGPSGLEKTVIHRHLVFDMASEQGVSVLVDTKDGLPLLIERQIDKGVVMFLGVTMDRAWSDLPIRPGFLPLIQRSIKRMGGRLDDRNPKSIEVGRPVSIEVSEGMQRLTIRSPLNKDTVYTAKELDGKSHVVFNNTEVPGEYTVWTDIPKIGGVKEQPALGFVTVTNPSESDLSRKMVVTAESRQERYTEVEGKLPIWPYLLFAAVFFIMAETVAASFGLRRSHLNINSSK